MKLQESPERSARPTKAIVRKSLFQRLEPWTGRQVCDLYAGIGALGIEALSRGAGHVTFVENHRPSVKLLKAHLLAGRLLQKAAVFPMDATTFLHRLQQRRPGYDILFADPPYHGPMAEQFLQSLGGSGLIQENGLAVIEHFHKAPLSESAGNLEWDRTCRYGDTLLSFYRPRGTSQKTNRSAAGTKEAREGGLR